MPSKMTTEMLLTGQVPDCRNSYWATDLINRVTPKGKHVEGALSLAEEILRRPRRLAVRAGVRVTRWPWVRAAAEADYYQAALRLHNTRDFEESARAFVEKRDPTYTGR